jgi:integrase
MKNEYTLFKRFKDAKNKKGIVWYFYYYDDNEKRIAKSTGLSTKYKAIEYAEIFLSTKNSKITTLFDFTTNFFVWGNCDWIRRQHFRGKTFGKDFASSRRSHLVNYILPKFGNRKIDSLNRVELENFIMNLLNKDNDNPLAAQTKNHILYTFRIVLREAEREGLVPHNCLVNVESFASVKTNRDVFTKDELNLLFPNDIDKLISIWGRREYAYLFYILATTGLRSGEVRALQWKHVIWDDCGGLKIVQGTKSDGSIGTTKTGNERVVIFFDNAKLYIEDWLKETPFNQMNDLIFFGSDRFRPITGKTLQRHFDSALKLTMINRTNRNIVIHSFRHTYNTLLRPLLTKDVLQAMTGHKTDSMTDRYDHAGLDSIFNNLQKNIKDINII